MENILKQPPKTLSIEELFPFYLDEELALIVPGTRLFRVDSTGDRYYYQIGLDQLPVFYLSMTSFIKSVAPSSKPLIDWRVRLGAEESDEAMRVAAAYGTFMHTRIAEFMRDGYYDHRDTLPALSDYCSYEGIPARFFGQWLDDLENDMLSFAQFVIDRKVKPLAIEFPACGPEGLAGMIDLPCQMDWDGKRVVAIVDFKSGRKGFYDEHALQLRGYQHLWNNIWNGTPYMATHTFNWAPVNWRGKPNYKLQNQTDAPAAARFPYYLEIFRLDGRRNPSMPFKRLLGPIEFGEPLDGKFEVLNMVDFVTRKIKDDARTLG